MPSQSKHPNKNDSNTLTGTPSRPQRTRHPPSNPNMVSPCPDGRRRVSLDQQTKSPGPSQRKRKHQSSIAVSDSNTPQSQDSSHESDIEVDHGKGKGKQKKSATRKKRKTTNSNSDEVSNCLACSSDSLSLQDLIVTSGLIVTDHMYWVEVCQQEGSAS
ncbi:uncharacterized protein MELLADRAFT_59702 [Melampsora larici-populina 98AG31]|uniref:Uncharacterized protein n=1 Tax=Melampsora larici-populina (strain 98AG31 / pathotype 3-4-7) TaxID=747676 RepID=F4R8J0_MELLP|nr:uncharacterized protein MELLADRAFT_59702 [Melampsora larici-populina 98AG31]EGG11591.1 hypothetical protein MELLADRAFT_59702 [Melampsora larici-populina 98AG31]